ncbi:MAG: molybdopterin dinucleotide binding domain-containing protein, partial [Rhodospirillales bacterium]|nr:molybdopterin dinucleotide binding domain-containing protein [Rhodospirillales bacterium]
ADAIRHPMVDPPGEQRPFQDVLLEMGAKLGFPGLIREGGRPRYPGGYADFMANHERQPGTGLLAGWRGPDGSEEGTGEANPDQVERYIENQCFWRHELPPGQRYFRNVNAAYLAQAKEMGFIKSSDPIIAQIYLEPMQRFRLASQGHGPVQPPDMHRQRIETYFDPLPFWYEPFDQPTQSSEEFPLHAITQRPMAMYHSWGSQNAWLRQIHGDNRLYIPRALGERLDLKDGDWAHLQSRSAKITVRVRLMDGVNARTVWTWNAIGKRAGAWNLDPDAGEVRDGFLLNHLIDDLLPADQSGFQHTRSDPITGQAAWYDLRVSISKAEAGTSATQPVFEPMDQPAGLAKRPEILGYGAGFRKPK